MALPSFDGVPIFIAPSLRRAAPGELLALGPFLETPSPPIPEVGVSRIVPPAGPVPPTAPFGCRVFRRPPSGTAEGGSPGPPLAHPLPGTHSAPGVSGAELDPTITAAVVILREALSSSGPLPGLCTPSPSATRTSPPATPQAAFTAAPGAAVASAFWPSPLGLIRPCGEGAESLPPAPSSSRARRASRSIAADEGSS